jgi:hypothetical protein
MEAILLCFLDTSAAAARRALVDLVSRSMTRGEAELIFMGDEAASTASPQRSVIAIRFRRWADAEGFVEEIQALLGADNPTASRMDTKLLSFSQATIGNTPLGTMFP